jgi:branched-subunit amino acid aminotransferase/4-amino-4-deoxychorismate lyase
VTNIPQPLVYLHGQLVPASQAQLAIYDAGVVLGATVTEQTRTFRKRPFRLDEHLDRLFRSLESAHLEIGLTRQEVKTISLELLEYNGNLLDDQAELGLIQFVTAGELAVFAPSRERPARNAPTVCIHTFPLPFQRWAKAMTDGAHLATPTICQLPPECIDPTMKNRSRMHYFLAEAEARQIDPAAWALLLDLNGHITETAAANFLMVKDGTIVSPTTRNILPGISRAMVFELAGWLGIPTRVRDIALPEALAADEAFLTSTPFCMLPVTSINNAAIGNGKPGPVFQRLLARWSAEVGVDIAAQMAS